VIVIHQPSFEEILAVARNLRAADIKELSVTRRDLSNPVKLATSAWAAKYRRAAYIGEKPVFVFGMTLFEGDPTQGQAWGFGTSTAHLAMKAVTKFIIRDMVPDMLGIGLVAVQAIGHPEHDLSARWLRRLGFSSMAATLPGVGAGTHPMILWITTASEHLPSYRARAA
jgi:hypothetical protein